MTELEERVAMRLVPLLVILASASVAILWTLDTTSSTSQSDFAIFLAMDLVSFAMISYVYRESKSGEEIHTTPLVAGAGFLILLVAAGLWILAS